MSLELSGVTKRFTNFAALDSVSFSVPTGAFLALLGPSGSGKTTLLRILAGLDNPDEGRVTFEGLDYLKLPARDRRVGMVFQSYALFRYMTVAQNIGFGLSVRRGPDKPNKAAIAAEVERLLKLIQLEGYGDRYPSQLSGGQRQRVALARALAISPRLMLLDEPFGALDAVVRKDLRRWLRHIHQETGVTAVFVTHDQEEALDLAQHVVVLNQGRVEQIGTPDELYHNPKSGFVFDFLGAANKIEVETNGQSATLSGLQVPLSAPTSVQGRQIARFRPTDVTLASAGPGLPARIQHVHAAGARIKLELVSADGGLFETDHAPATLAFAPTAGMNVVLQPSRLFVL